MSAPLFAPLFEYIESNLHAKINLPDAARVVSLSPVHLTRLFSFAYGITPAEYIRRRRLSESLRLLLETDQTVLEIALRFGFSHEQSFTRAFCAEFGTTPGKYRNERTELPVLLPIPDFGIPFENGTGHLFGPEIVFLPKIRLLGIWHTIPYRNSAKLAPAAALNFWDRSRLELPGGENATVFYGLTRHPGKDGNPKNAENFFRDSQKTENIGNQIPYSYYLTAIETDIPNFSQFPCFACDSFGGGPCVKFHYIGRHHYRELSQKTAQQMYRAIRRHIYSENAVSAIGGSVHLEKINAGEFDGEYCLMEWYAPVSF